VPVEREFFLMLRPASIGAVFAVKRSVVHVRLTRKLALCMNGIDVSALKVGDVLELPEDRARAWLGGGSSSTAD
jgi:hypothetical protein